MDTLLKQLEEKKNEIERVTQVGLNLFKNSFTIIIKFKIKRISRFIDIGKRRRNSNYAISHGSKYELGSRNAAGSNIYMCVLI